MLTIKKFIARNFSGFTFFYQYLRYRLLLAVVFSIIVGLLDGLGLSMFLPFLKMAVNNPGIEDEGSLGKLAFLMDWLEREDFSFNLFTILGIMAVFFILKGLSQFLSRTYQIILQQNFIRQMRIRMLNALNVIAFKDFVTSDVGRIQNTMTGEVENVSQAYSYYFLSVEQFVLVSVYLSFAFLVNFEFAILVIVGGGFTNFLFKIIYKKTKNTSRSLTSYSHVYQGQVIQHVANFKYLRATGLTEHFAQKLEKTIQQIESKRKKMGVYGAVLTAVREPLLIIVLAVVIIIQTQFMGGSLGGILLSLIFFYRGLNSLVAMQTSWNKFLERSGSLENVIDFQHSLEESPTRDGQSILENFSSNITLNKVNFSYGNQQVINEVDLKIYKNKSVAIVGESGSGKTTLVNLIAGLLPSDDGKITVDGIPYENLKLISLQRKIGYITQEPVIFNDTIFNNISLWDEKNSENLERFNLAVQKASLEDLLNQLPNHGQTVLGNNGINLSGGQKQRMSIARELYKNVEILIMDEATSALDTETERSIQKSIDFLKGKLTLIIIAHRLSTIKSADRIVLMKHGSIADEGTYEELMRRLPQFKKMIDLQKV